MKDSIEITYKIEAPKTIIDSTLNTIILLINDYRELIGMGSPLDRTANKIVDTIKNEVNNLYL